MFKWLQSLFTRNNPADLKRGEIILVERFCIGGNEINQPIKVMIGPGFNDLSVTFQGMYMQESESKKAMVKNTNGKWEIMNDGSMTTINKYCKYRRI